MEHMPWDEKDGSTMVGKVFKDGSPDNPAITIEDCIILMGKGPEARDIMPNNLKLSRNNIVIWMGTRSPVCEGFTEYGPEGKPIWDEARLKWINNHPLVHRLPGDPVIGTTEIRLAESLSADHAGYLTADVSGRGSR
jgi:hypothetical protein